MHVLSFLRKKIGSDAEAKPQQATEPHPQQPQVPASPKRGGSRDDDALEVAAELQTGGRRASQVNLNRYLSAAPAGLSAALKNPSLGDLLAEPPSTDARASSPHGAPQPQASDALQPPQPSQEPGYEPSVRGGRMGRERRKSVSLSELAQGVQNLDVSHAALIMMPVRLKAELGPQASVLGATGAPLPLISRSVGLPAGSFGSALAGPGPGSGGADAAAGGAGGLGSGASLAAARNLDRKPSIIREAVKQQQGYARTGPHGLSPSYRSSINGMPSGSGAGSSPAYRSPMNGPAMGPASQQQGPGPSYRTSTNGLGPGHSAVIRSSINGLHTGATALQLLTSQPAGSALASPAAGRGDKQQSESGEGLQSRPAPPATLDVARGLNRSWGSGADEAAGAPSPGVGEAVSPQATQAGGSGATQDGEGPRPGSNTAASLSGDLRLPKVAGPGNARRDRDRDRERDAGASPAAARLTVSHADVAAITEKMNAYQSEAGRLRAKALRKVDSKIKRAVMGRYMKAEPDYSGAPLPDTNALTPTLRMQAQMKARPSLTSQTPPPALQQLLASTDRPQLPGSHRVGAPPSAGRARPQESYAMGVAEDEFQLPLRGGVSGPRA